MSETVHLALPYIAAAQAQKHVTHNEALRILDALVMLAAKDRDLSAPPGSLADGDRYLVSPAGSGDFAGKDNQVAHFRDGAWEFLAPQAGWVCYVEDEDIAILFDGADWVPLLGANPQLQNVSLLGLGTTADATNPFSAKLNNALWTARYDSEGGDGSLRTAFNKESAADVVSLLLQTGNSGRAEIGLIGDDDLAFKVSADGSVWIEALKIDRSDGTQTIAGHLRLEQGGDRAVTVRKCSSGAGNALTVSGGEATGTNQAGGNLVLSAGNSTGDQGADIILAAPTPGASGATVATATAKARLTGDGLFGVGTGSTRPLAGIHAAAQDASSTRGIAVSQHNNANSAAQANFYKSRGTFASPSQISAGDNIGAFFARPYVNGDYRNMAAFGFVQTGTISGDDAPTDIVFSPGETVISFAAAEKFRFASSGDLKMGGSGGIAVITSARHPQLRSYTVSTLPSAATAGQLIYVSNETGGAVPAFSDGTNWRRLTDRAIVA